MKTIAKNPRFLGATTIGERGQVVIPAAARKSMGIEPGSKLLVFLMEAENMVFIAKPSHLERFASRLSTKLKGLNKILDASNA